MSYNGIRPVSHPRSILVVRLGAMGDIIHALPAVAHLRRSFPQARITWAVDSRWSTLLNGNPDVHEILALPISVRQRRLNILSWKNFQAVRTSIRARNFDLAIDFQGLLKSALVVFFSGADRAIGFTRNQLREPISSFFYSDLVPSKSQHIVEKNLDLARAIGAKSGPITFPIPDGKPSQILPSGEFILANPIASWMSKQWPSTHYAELAKFLWKNRKIPLVIDFAPQHRACAEEIYKLAPDGSVVLHPSSLEGLIAATRRARAVVGVDSGPLHLASALGIGGVAIYGQTDPARNGPFGGNFVVLRAPGAITSYRRVNKIHETMIQISPQTVWKTLDRYLSREMAPADQFSASQ